MESREEKRKKREKKENEEFLPRSCIYKRKKVSCARQHVSWSKAAVSGTPFSSENIEDVRYKKPVLKKKLGPLLLQIEEDEKPLCWAKLSSSVCFTTALSCEYYAKWRVNYTLKICIFLSPKSTSFGNMRPWILAKLFHHVMLERNVFNML